MPREAATSAPDDGAPRLPRSFGRYALFDFIGRGGMAEIFLARATTELGAARLCVVKKIIPAFAKHPQFAEMLIHEAKLAARLNHAHIVQVFDLGRSDDDLYIAMEYVEGYDLNALLRRCSQAKVPLPFEYALGIVCDVLRALDYAHRRTDDAGKPLGIVHRDVSPSNVLISLEGEVKLCDFGIAHANDLVQQVGEHVDEAIKGKAGYMSPEHARGEPIDARADVFAAGIVLWELISGRRMYRKEPGGMALLDQARRAQVPPLPLKSLPHETRLHAIVDRALAVPRDERYPSASAMLRDLQSYMSEAKLMASTLKLGEWLVDRFGADFNEQRGLRERLSPAAPNVSWSEPPPPASPRGAPSARASSSSSSSSSPVPSSPSVSSRPAMPAIPGPPGVPSAMVTPAPGDPSLVLPPISKPILLPEQSSSAPPPAVTSATRSPESHHPSEARASVSPLRPVSAPPRPTSSGSPAAPRYPSPFPGRSSSSQVASVASVASPSGSGSASAAATSARMPEPSPSSDAAPPVPSQEPSSGALTPVTVEHPPVPILAAATEVAAGTRIGAAASPAATSASASASSSSSATTDFTPGDLPIISLARPTAPGIPPWVLLVIAAIVVVLALVLMSRSH
jgi:serine/threonine protein kinase